MRVNSEKDFHGFSAAEMLRWLNQEWASHRWDGLQRVRIIHGKGEVLIPALRKWCDDKGIPWAPESGNPGATILHPVLRASHTAVHRHRPMAKVLAHLRKPDNPRKTSSEKGSKSVLTPGPKDAELFE